jgi:hypothetical protein
MIPLLKWSLARSSNSPRWAKPILAAFASAPLMPSARARASRKTIDADPWPQGRGVGVLRARKRRAPNHLPDALLGFPVDQRHINLACHLSAEGIAQAHLSTVGVVHTPQR